MNTPVLSICIPTKNRTHFLRETLLKITNDDFFLSSDKVELVISDNCSDDSTQSLCEFYASKFPNKVRYFRQPVDILDKNFIEVLKLAKGKYAKLQNDNLYFYNGALEKIVSLLEKSDENQSP